jgi:hypothetical protein
MSVIMLNVWAIMHPRTVLFGTNAAPWLRVFFLMLRKMILFDAQSLMYL